MRPVSASRARNLITYFPGRSVKPVSYSIGRFWQLTGVLTGQLDIHLVAQILNCRPIVVFDFADEID